MLISQRMHVLYMIVDLLSTIICHALKADASQTIVGLEPTRSFMRGLISALCLPIPSYRLPHISRGNATRTWGKVSDCKRIAVHQP